MLPFVAYVYSCLIVGDHALHDLGSFRFGEVCFKAHGVFYLGTYSMHPWEECLCWMTSSSDLVN